MQKNKFWAECRSVPTRLFEWRLTMSEKTKFSRHACREAVFKMLFAKDFQREADAETFYSFYIENSEYEDVPFMSDLFYGVCTHLDEIDSQIEAVSLKWKLSRMSVATRTVLRLAVYEIAYTDVPKKVAINEALELIKDYDEEGAPAFVNGILNKIARGLGMADGENEA